MKLYFGSRLNYFKHDKMWEELRDDIQYVAEVNTIKEAFHWLDEKLNELGFESYYKNCNIANDHTWIEVDFGSWSRFLLIYDMTPENYTEFMKGETE